VNEKLSDSESDGPVSSHPFVEELDLLLRARFTLMIVTTSEEDRALRLIAEQAERAQRPVLIWDIASGFVAPAGGAVPTAADPLAALDSVKTLDGNHIIVLKDFHDFWKDARTKRRLRNLAEELKFTRKSLIITTPMVDVPGELSDDAVRITLDGPNLVELDEILTGLEETQGLRNELTVDGRARMIQAAVGLSANEALRCFSKVIVRDGVLNDEDVDDVTSEKQAIIRGSGALEFYPANTSTADVGGLETLKEWIRLRERAFGQEAHDYGLPAPKGIALIGIPGTGKSLTAKAIGGMWRLPLIRLDIGAVFGSLVGESEERIRKALRLTEQIAPCVLWIDELEKALASGGGDGGTSQRVIGTLLTWMQDKKEPVFVVATANDISALPPEMLRRGRFDEVFFLDLPTYDERIEIIRVHLKKRKRDPDNFDLPTLATASALYVGAEIEQALIDAMYAAFNDGREVTSEDFARALERLVPLSRSQKEQIVELRKWLEEGRAQSASFSEQAAAVESTRTLSLVALDLPATKKK
jgi:AAA+ superfamily predicted ATPase